MRIGIIGGGQLGWLLGAAARELGYECTFIDPQEKCTAAQVGNVLPFAFDDERYITPLLQACDLVTYEFENINLEILHKIAQQKPVFPNPEVLALSQDRFSEKATLQACGMIPAPYLKVDHFTDLEEASKKLGFPFILKTRRMGYDGKGQTFIKTRNELETLRHSPLQNHIAEQWISFDFEVSKIAARNMKGEIAFYPLVKNLHHQGILRTSTSPLTETLHQPLDVEANRLIQGFMDKYNYVGVLTVEFFVVGDQLIVNECAPRVHNSGHWTLNAGISSQFENHIRAITGLPLGKTLPDSFCAMINIIGEFPNRERLTAIQGLDIYDYGKEERAGRKLGHINMQARSYPELLNKIEEVTNICS